MVSFEKQQNCARRYAASSNTFQGITRLIGWLGLVASVISFFLGFFGAIGYGAGIVVAIALLAISGFVILIGNVIQHQCEAILAILDLVGEQQHKQDNAE